MALALRKVGLERAILSFVTAVSVGIYEGKPVLDLDYAEDSAAQTDMNVVQLEGSGFIELQGTAEGKAFTSSELSSMLELAEKGMNELLEMQRKAFKWTWRPEQ